MSRMTTVSNMDKGSLFFGGGTWGEGDKMLNNYKGGVKIRSVLDGGADIVCGWDEESGKSK